MCVYMFDARADDWLGPLTALAGYSITSCRISSYSKPQPNATGKRHWEYRSHARPDLAVPASTHCTCAHTACEKRLQVSVTPTRHICTHEPVVEPNSLDLRTVLAHRSKPQFSTLRIASQSALLWTSLAADLHCCGPALL